MSRASIRLNKSDGSGGTFAITPAVQNIAEIDGNNVAPDVDNTVLFTGLFLDMVDSVSIDDGTVSIVSQNSVNLKLTLNAPEGTRQVTLTGAFGTSIIEVEVKSLTVIIPQVADWTNITDKVTVGVGEIYPIEYPASGSTYDKGANFGTVPAGSDFVLSFTADFVSESPGLTGNGMAGCSQEAGGISYVDIDYSIYIMANGSVGIYESGSNKRTLSGTTIKNKSGDKYKITRKENVIRYYWNDMLVYTSNIPSINEMYFDCSIAYRLGLKDIKMEY